jgi:hypothetical protein
MRTSRGHLALAVVATHLAPACRKPAPELPSREAVTAELRLEAEGLKRDGEKMDPSLGVKATWNIVSVEVTERPGDADRPWAGSILFKIHSETKDMDRPPIVYEFERRFDYLYVASVKRWIFDYKPTPAP